jgi:carboxylesterase type B
MARRLAEEGHVVVIMEYTLYPAASAEHMVGEVDAALEWVFKHIGAYGGCPDQVVLMGHSAGVYDRISKNAPPSNKQLYHRAFTISYTQLL